MNGLFLSPSGHLRLSDDHEGKSPLDDALAAALRDAFEHSSADGLLLLATAPFDRELPAEFVFWRGFAREFFRRLCHQGAASAGQWQALDAPVNEELTHLVADAPAMRGLEYLTPEVLARLWRELGELVAKRAQSHPDGPAAWLESVHPLWHLVGRVTFHLAENKRDPQHPFAFLATFTHGLSNQARLQHLPLSDALKEYASARDQAKLVQLLEPVRRAAERSGLVRELLDTKKLFAAHAWSIRDAHRFLLEAPRIEQAGVVVRLPDWWSPRTPPRPQVQVRIGVAAAGELGMNQLLDFDVGMAIDGQPLTDQERRQVLDSTEGLLFLRGRWVEVDAERIKQALDHWKDLERQHARGISFLDGMRLLAGASTNGHDDDEVHLADWSRISAGDWLKQTLDRLRRPESIDACQPGRDLQATLRPYQSVGVRWLWFITELGLGGCLADDMGLGKTVQVIDLLLVRKRQAEQAGEKRPPGLLVLPATLIGNWRQELARFAPSLRVFFAHRSECSAEELAAVAKNPSAALDGYDLVVTTYGLVRRQAWLQEAAWSLIVLDEAQAIKNAGSRQTQAVKKLQAPSKLALTGTPVENNLGDLWSLFDFCCPGLLGSAAQFKKFIKELDRQQQAHSFGALRRLVRPYILRRLKTDPNIVPDLPDKTEMRADCGLSRKQAVLYERAVEELAQRLESAEGMARRGVILATLMQLKQICNHPAQYVANSSYVPEESGKFERLRALCEPIALRQEKALIFTQFRVLTQPVADFLGSVFGRPGLVLHGGTPVGKRAELVRNFQDEQGPPFFVISLKAGGSGLNLTAANHVIHFDRWWNPAVENQATDRAFRIGQKRNVVVHKFVCRGTVEERIDALIRSKQSLADRLLDQEGETLLTEMSDDELLRFVALDIARATAEE